MGLGSGEHRGSSTSVDKWYAVRHGRKTGIFGTWEQVQEQISGFEGAVVKEFERNGAGGGGVDRGLLQAKMWLRSGSQPEMPPPASRPPACQQNTAAAPARQRPPLEEEPNLPSARRFSPMLLNALHWGFFGDLGGREVETTAGSAGEDIAASHRRRPGALSAPTLKGLADAASAGRPEQCAAATGQSQVANKGSDAIATVKRAAKRARLDEPPGGDLYARTYQERRGNRSVLS